MGPMETSPMIMVVVAPLLQGWTQGVFWLALFIRGTRHITTMANLGFVKVAVGRHITESSQHNRPTPSTSNANTQVTESIYIANIYAQTIYVSDVLQTSRTTQAYKGIFRRSVQETGIITLT